MPLKASDPEGATTGIRTDWKFSSGESVVGGWVGGQGRWRSVASHQHPPFFYALKSESADHEGTVALYAVPQR